MSDSPIDLAVDETHTDQPIDQGADVSPHVNSDDAFSSQQALAAITIKLSAGDAVAAAAAPATASTSASSPLSSSARDVDSLPWLHLLPCRIAHTGPANVPNYWQPTRSAANTTVLTCGPEGSVLQSVDTDLYESTFRGRQMTGAVIQLPANAKGFLFEEDTRSAQAAAAEATHDDDDANGGESHAPATASAATHWKSCGTFDSLVLWQADQELFERRHIHETIRDWIPIAHAIHDV